VPPRPGRGTGKRKRGHGRRSGDHGEHEEGSERWLVTYADVLTLLLVLFIVLFSISVVNTSKYISLKTSLASVFGNGVNGIMDGGHGLEENSAEGEGQQLVMAGAPVTPVTGKKSSTDVTSDTGYTKQKLQQEVDEYRQIRRQINAALRAHGRAGDVRFAITKRGLVITVLTNALVFPGNSARLLPEGQRLLQVVAGPLVSKHNDVEVDGYTNQENVSTYPYPSGWELSSARASAVVRYLIARGVAESRLSAVGWSDQKPLYPRSDPRSVTFNRRVEIVVLSDLPATAGAALQAAGGN
jgi:chemotaxis protein MotB